jgi:hypothetical protein
MPTTQELFTGAYGCFNDGRLGEAEGAFRRVLVA